VRQFHLGKVARDVRRVREQSGLLRDRLDNLFVRVPAGVNGHAARKSQIAFPVEGLDLGAVGSLRHLVRLVSDHFRQRPLGPQALHIFIRRH
jgi:hypothetical protein